MRKEVSLRVSIILDDNYQNIQISGDVSEIGEYKHGGYKDYGDGNNGNELTLISVGECVCDYLSQFESLEKYSIKPQADKQSNDQQEQPASDEELVETSETAITSTQEKVSRKFSFFGK